MVSPYEAALKLLKFGLLLHTTLLYLLFGGLWILHYSYLEIACLGTGVSYCSSR